MFALVITLVAGRKAFVPPSAPVIIKIRFDGVRLGRYPRVVPEEVAAGIFPNEIVNLRTHVGQNREAQPVVLHLDSTQSAHVCSGIYSCSHSLLIDAHRQPSQLALARAGGGLRDQPDEVPQPFANTSGSPHTACLQPWSETGSWPS